jgi:hypothetical protein
MTDEMTHLVQLAGLQRGFRVALLEIWINTTRTISASHLISSTRPRGPAQLPVHIFGPVSTRGTPEYYLFNQWLIRYLTEYTSINNIL